MRLKYRFEGGSIGSDWEIEMPCGEVEHGDEVVGIAIAAGFTFGGGEDAGQSFH